MAGAMSEIIHYVESCRGLSPPHTPPYVPFMAYGGFLTFTDYALQ